MLVMDVGIVGVRVPHGLMHVHVGMRPPRVDARRMLVLVMLVMVVPVLMFQVRMLVLVRVHLGDVQPESGGHQPRCRNERPSQRIPQERDGERRADERSG